MDRLTLQERLLQLDTCVLSDALDVLSLDGVAPGLTALTCPTRVAGRVQTVHVGAAGSAPPSRHLATAAVANSQPGDIIAIDAGGFTGAASWGGLLCAAAVMRRLAGVIVDGAARDIDEARDLALPVYGSAAVCRTARGRLQELDWNQPVHIAGVLVRPGDLAVADASGVVFIPSQHAEEIASTAEALAGRERAILDEIQSGVPAESAMSVTYEAMLAAQKQGGHHG